MTSFEKAVAALNWILDTAAAPGEPSAPPRQPLWRLEFLESDQFLAKTSRAGGEFLIQLSSAVWPCLQAFCACGIEWKGNAREPRRKTFQYSKDEWETIVALTNDLRYWSIIDDVNLSRMLEHSPARKRLRMPLGTGGMKIDEAAAFYGLLWLVCHEGTHAWRRHLELEGAKAESIREQSEFLSGGELHRTLESEADWQAARFVYAYVLECVLAGFQPALAYALGFGVAAAVLLLNPCRHGLFDRPEVYDPGWMRLHFLTGAARAGYWTIAESHYPVYVESLRRQTHAVQYEPGVARPTARFDQAAGAAQNMFWAGLGDAQHFAMEIGEANSTYEVAPAGHFKFGDPGDWKEFQARTIDSDVLGIRERARNELRALLPSDPRFEEAGPLGPGALLRMLYLAAQSKGRP